MKQTVIFCLCLCLLSVSCKKESEFKDIRLPADTAMNDANNFAVIVETYVSFRDKPGDFGITIAHARRKDVFPVKGLDIITKDNNQILWVDLGEGWVPRSCVQLYSSEAKAITASKNLK
ncbi:hypothetical protein DWQ65_04830 [Treponema phagedenis]|uniref:SH3 domain-containing protein n=1 Tax=Treponema phagedenis TaxID=162 RepID=A0A0B7GVX9_TREPH|nr:hypothetical protein [Treponema phagedenis]EFW39142.1 hypothetical protein HMPREF9554_00384 [Treponema phagedenis F0421]NVP23167.1 hypothetical protein [Treponema phagedenis]QEJ94842.1 hypothetical protein FUT79_06210 [Treponema phagedenis]QEJ98025.1 hypothetical protein FUT82_08465 [Treponema phagedenis]QEK00743.1 hypothetical protein FUT84_05880 [Treponema phagedenis]